MHVKTLQELFNYVKFKRFHVLNGQYNAQFVMVGKTLCLKYWMKTNNPPYKWIQCNSVRKMDRNVNLIVQIL